METNIDITTMTVQEVMQFCVKRPPREIPGYLRQELASSKPRQRVIDTLLVDMATSLDASDRYKDSAVKAVQFETAIRILVEQEPTRTLQWGVYSVDNHMGASSDASWQATAMPVPPHNASVEVNAEYAMEQPTVVEFLDQQKKINAIKELRQLTNMGLKEAKDAVDLLQSWRQRGYVPTAERMKIDQEAEEAIASIRKTMATMDTPT